VVSDGIYVHSLHDMTLLHQISNPLHNVPRVCILSSGMPVCGKDTPSYMAYSNCGDMKIFDAVNLVSMYYDVQDCFVVENNEST